MELMFLVYAVENLTYNSNFWYGVFIICTSISAIAYVSNWVIKYLDSDKTNFEKVTSSTLAEDDKLSVGRSFVLDRHMQGLIAREEYTVSAIYRSLNDMRIEGQGTTDFDIKLIEEQLRSQEHKVEIVKPSILNIKFPWKIFLVIGIMSMVMHTVLPSRQTAIYMAGAYLVQEVATSESVQELGKASYNAALSQLNKWSSEVPALAEMVADAGLESSKSKVVEIIGDTDE